MSAIYYTLYQQNIFLIYLQTLYHFTNLSDTTMSCLLGQSVGHFGYKMQNWAAFLSKPYFSVTNEVTETFVHLCARF